MAASGSRGPMINRPSPSQLTGWNICGSCSRNTNVKDHPRGLERTVTDLERPTPKPRNSNSEGFLSFLPHFGVSCGKLGHPLRVPDLTRLVKLCHGGGKSDFPLDTDTEANFRALTAFRIRCRGAAVASSRQGINVYVTLMQRPYQPTSQG